MPLHTLLFMYIMWTPSSFPPFFIFCLWNKVQLQAFFSPFATPHFDHTAKACNNQDQKRAWSSINSGTTKYHAWTTSYRKYSRYYRLVSIATFRSLLSLLLFSSLPGIAQHLVLTFVPFLFCTMPDFITEMKR